MQLGWGRRLRHARLAAGYERQEDLEQALGMAPRTVSNWERGLQMCHPIDLYRVAKKLSVTMDWLTAGDDRFLTVDAKRRLSVL